MSVTIIDTINNLDVTDDSIVTLRYEDSHEGWHSTGDLEEQAIKETCTADMVAELITDKKLAVRTAWGDENALDAMRDKELLENYERGDFDFETYISETIKENPFDLDEFVEFSVQQYDHKRGRCTVSAEFRTTVANLKESPDGVSGWEVSVETNGGTFTLGD